MVALKNMSIPRDKTFFLLLPLFLFAEVFLIYGTTQISVYTPVILLAGLFLWITLKYPVTGICTVILFHFFTLQSTEAINIYEILYAVYFLTFLGGWFFRSFLIEKKWPIRNRYEYALILFFGICLFSLFPAVLFGNDMTKWFRELVPFTTLLLYFPARDYLNTKLRIILALASVTILCLVVSVNNVLNYREFVLQATYQWEFQTMRQHAGEPMIMFMILLFLGLFIYSRTIKQKLLFMSFVVLFAVALGITFTRGYWLGVGTGVIFLFLFLEFKKKMTFSLYALFLSIVMIAALYIYLGDTLIYFYKAIIGRFSSVGALEKDISMMNRLSEYKSVLRSILKNPVIGYGLGAEFTYYNLILSTFKKTWYTHNVYFYFLFKLGIMGLSSFLYFYFRMLFRGLKKFRNENDLFVKGILLALVCNLFALLVISLTSPQFIQKDSLLIVSLSFGIFAGISINRKNVSGDFPE